MAAGLSLGCIKVRSGPITVGSATSGAPESAKLDMVVCEAATRAMGDASRALLISTHATRSRATPSRHGQPRRWKVLKRSVIGKTKRCVS